MVNPMEILPILVLVLMIVCIPLLSDGPPGLPDAGRKEKPRARSMSTHKPH
ncbi:MAG TPA: hypothetical protein VM867_09070 [Xanthobacteraceae bacterium]|nr:hypothetical protein [Xanthobacteraceae bacterium]